MDITIYFKQGAPLPSIRYRMDIDDFRRLSEDFQQFLQTGSPKDGLYQVYNSRHGDTSLQSKRALHLNFEEISIIG